VIDRTLKIIPVGKYEAVTAMTVNDLLETAVPARSFLGNAKLNPLDERAVGRLRELHKLIQRDFAGQKKTNARGALADYISDEWLPANGSKPAAGFIPAFILYFPDELEIDQEDGMTAHIRSRGIFVDGESRGEALLTNLERLGDAEYDRLVKRSVAVHIIHGVGDPKVIAKYFADVNGKGVGVNPNLVVMTDYTDPYAEITKRVFERLGLELETRQRQVSAKSAAVLTGLQARTMVAAVARGVSAVQYGGKPIPDDGVDLDKLETTAESWLSRVFSALRPERFRDKGYIIRAVPVSSSLGALGRAHYDGDSDGQRKALQVLDDDTIDWSVGEHWAAIAGRVNPNTGRFAVGGGKEYAYATYRALTEPESDIGSQIRGKVAPPTA
jgi:DNA sulfur modification protein DndB